MATATTGVTVPLEVSLAHDCEWVDGEVRERFGTDAFHSAMQAFFVFYFAQIKAELGLTVWLELRLKVSASRYRVPDVLLLRKSTRFESIPATPPVLCIEIQAPEDRASDFFEKLDDYIAMGVRAIWMVDPRRRLLWTADAQGMHVVKEFRVPESERVITPAEMFAELDSL